MKTYTQPELYKALAAYAKKEKALLAEAKAAVVEWKYAKEPMYSLFPLSPVIGFRGSNKWKPATRGWLKEPKDFCCHHGFDAQGNVRILNWTNGMATIFVPNGDVIDEIVIGGRGMFLMRHLFESGRAVACYDYRLDPHQYSLETFEYTDDRLMKSVEHSWFVNDGAWEKATWATTCTYEYDDAGLLRVHRDMGERLGKDLVFVRPNSGRLKEAGKPRPMVAYTNDSDIQSDAYGLEMNIDDEWLIDTVILVPPGQTSEVTLDTGVTTMGTVCAGASSMPAVSELRKIKKAGGTWVLMEAKDKNAPENLSAILKAGLKAMILAADEAAVRSALAECEAVNFAHVTVAFAPGKSIPPDRAQAIAAKIRAELKAKEASKSRIIIAAPIGKEEIMDYLAKPDIDGVLHENGGFEWAMEVLVPIALNRAK